MRRIAVVCCALYLLISLPGCQAVADFLTRGIFRGLAQDYDSSRPTSEERGEAFDKYIEENVDNDALPKAPETHAAADVW